MKKKNLITLDNLLLDSLSYSGMVENNDHLIIDQQYVRVMYISGYPYVATSGWMDSLIGFNQDCDISFFIEEVKATLALPKLQRKITELESTKRAMLKDGKIISSEISDPLTSAIELRDKILRGQEKLFQYSIYVAIRAESLAELDRITSLLEVNLASKLFYSKIANFQQIDGLQSILPRLDNKLNIKRNLSSSSAALSMPFISSELVHENGILYGINKSNNSLVIVDRFDLDNANSIVFAQSGSGKSYLSKIEILRQLAAGVQVIVIDPEREYQKLCNDLGGNYIDLSTKSTNHLDPFNIDVNIKGKHLSDHVQELTAIIELMVDGLNAQEKNIVDKILLSLYKKPTKQPNIEIFYDELSKYPGSEELCKKLHRFVHGSLSNTFKSNKKIDTNNRFIVFDIKDLPENIKQILLLVVSNFVSNLIKFNTRKRLLVIDEGWMLIENPQTAEFISGLVRRARKYYLGISIITQQASDFLNNKYGKAIASQSSLRILMKQDTTCINEVVAEFGLSDFEKNYLLSANKGDSLMLVGQHHVAVEIVSSKEEHPIITTNPKELYE